MNQRWRAIENLRRGFEGTRTDAVVVVLLAMLVIGSSHRDLDVQRSSLGTAAAAAARSNGLSGRVKVQWSESNEGPHLVVVCDAKKRRPHHLRTLGQHRCTVSEHIGRYGWTCCGPTRPCRNRNPPLMEIGRTPGNSTQWRYKHHPHGEVELTVASSHFPLSRASGARENCCAAANGQAGKESDSPAPRDDDAQGCFLSKGQHSWCAAAPSPARPIPPSRSCLVVARCCCVFTSLYREYWVPEYLPLAPADTQGSQGSQHRQPALLAPVTPRHWPGIISPRSSPPFSCLHFHPALTLPANTSLPCVSC